MIDKKNLLIIDDSEIDRSILKIILIDDFAGGWPVQAGQHMQQGGFAAAALARNGGKGALSEAQVHVLQGVHRRAAALVGFRQAFTA